MPRVGDVRGRSRYSRRSDARCGTPALEWAIIGTWYVKVIAVLAGVRVRGIGVASYAALVAEITLDAGLSVNVRDFVNHGQSDGFKKNNT